MLRRRFIVSACWCALWCCPIATAASQEPRIEVELLTERDFPVSAQQHWYKLFQDLGVSRLRMRQGRDGELIEVKNLGSARAPSYRITGVLTARNTLRFPGTSFRSTDRARIAAWLNKLKTDGIDAVGAPRVAYGLTPKLLVEVHEKLAKPVRQTTSNVPTSTVVQRITSSIDMTVTIDDTARQALAGREVVLDELQGVSSGTALAAAIRPLGLVMAPEPVTGGKMQLRIADAQQIKSVWPIGWPPEKPPGQVAPQLFKFLNAEIEDRPLSEALSAIRELIEIPMVVDYNSLARQRIRMDEVKVTLPRNRTFYKNVIDKCLRQAQLKSELRTDEAGMPLLWISTIKR